MAKKLYVGNLSFDMTDQELEGIFSEYGKVTSASVVTDRYTNKSRGFGFVEFAEDADAIKAKEAVDGKDFGGRSLRVDEAKEPRERESRERPSRNYSSGRGSRY
jgi:RNA recognition motif-containing protein